MRYTIALLTLLSFGIAEATPRVVSVIINPKIATTTIGSSVDFVATAIYDSGEEIEFIDGFNSDGGGIFDYGTFIPAKIGTFTIANAFEKKTGTAMVVVLATQTATGSETILAPSYVAHVEISPSDAVINAGDSISFFATAYYNTGETRDMSDGFVCDLGIFTSNNFSSQVAGRASITIDCNGVTGQAFVSVLPAPPHKLTIKMADTFDYGYLYPLASLVDYSLYDKYGNPTEFDKSKCLYQIQKNSKGILGQQLGGGVTTNPILKALAPIIKAGYIADKDNILFFERGNYTVTANYNGIVGIKNIDVDFASPYQNVEAWKDYRIVKIDFEKSVIEAGYSVMPNDTEEIRVPQHFLEKFYEGSFIDKFQTICLGHYLILQKRTEIIKEANRQQMNGLLRLLLKDGIVK